MKQNTQKSQKSWASRFGAFAAVLGLGLTVLFMSTASADPVNTDPVISVEGTCDLWGPDTPGFTMSIANNDSWDESYGIGVFDGFYEDTGDLIEGMPEFVIEEEVEAESISGGQFLLDAFFATIQVINITENGGFGGLVFHQSFLICVPDLPDFGDDENEENEDGPGFNFDFIPELPDDPQIPDFDFNLPDLGFGDDENEENDDEDGEDAPVVVEGNDDEDGEDAPVVVEGNDDEDSEDAPVVVEGNDDEDSEDAPVVVEGNDDNSGQEAPVEVVNNDDNSGQEAPVEVVNNDDNSGQDVPVVVEGNDDEDGEDAPVVVEGNDNEDGEDAPVEIVNNTDEGNAVFEWENITVSEATEIGRPPDPEINPEDTDDKDNDAGDSIGQPPEPKINPEDTDDKKDSEELASIEGKDSQGKSGLSILWIILIIVGGVATVGTTTRAIQKNNS
jgi:hypothetical protein